MRSFIFLYIEGTSPLGRFIRRCGVNFANIDHLDPLKYTASAGIVSPSGGLRFRFYSYILKVRALWGALYDAAALFCTKIDHLDRLGHTRRPRNHEPTWGLVHSFIFLYI